MAQLVTDWLLDPLALLFLLSLALVAVVSWRSRVRRGRGSRRFRGNYTGKIALGAWITLFLVTSAPAIVYPMLAMVENRYADAPACEAGASVVVLGGGSSAGKAAEVADRLSANSGAVRLVTSALHMPRAVATFERAGVNVCPDPVQSIAMPDVPRWALMPQTTAFVKFGALLREWLATAFYRLSWSLEEPPASISSR